MGDLSQCLVVTLFVIGRDWWGLYLSHTHTQRGLLPF